MLRLALLILLASTSLAQGRVTPRDIQNAQQQAAQLHKQGRYVEEAEISTRIYHSCRDVYGVRHIETGSAAFRLGRLHCTLGNCENAEPLLVESLQIFRAQNIPNDTNVAAVLNTLGTLYSRLGQVRKAEACWNECLRVLKGAQSPERISVVRFNLASLYRQVGLSRRAYARRAPTRPLAEQCEQEALACFGKAREYILAEIEFVRGLRRRLAPNDPRMHNRESVLGEVCLDLGAYAEADGLFTRAKEFSDRVYGKDRHGRDLLLLGLSRGALGKWTEAADLFRRAVAFARESVGEYSPITIGATALEANALGILGRVDEAGALMDRCMRLERRYALRAFPSLSESEQLSYVFRKTYTEGVWLETALGLGARSKQLAALSAEWLVNGKALLYELLGERSALARDLARPDTGPIAKEFLAVRQEIGRQLTNLNAAAQGSGELDAARGALSKLIAREEELGKKLGRTAGRANRPEWIDLATVRAAIPAESVLVEFARYEPGAGGPPRYAAWIVPHANEGDVAAVDLGAASEIDAALAVLRAGTDTEISALIAKEADAVNAQLAAYAKANGLKPSDEAFQKKLASLKAAVEETIAQGVAQLAKGYRAKAEAFASLALWPVLPHVGKAKALRLSPDAHLWLAPWAALPLPDDGPYALERFAISYVVTGRDLLRPRGAVETGPPLVLGDVDYDLGVTDAARRVPHPVKPLPASAAEVRSVTPLLEKLTKRKPMSFIGAAAREERVKAAHRPQVLFLSTHGGFGSVEETILRPGQSALLLENPMLRCTLSFAGCNLRETGGEDGHLYGFEIEALDLAGTELVVLSACQTAIGDVHAGQSAASLRQAFQIAGARNVIATLWSVEDRAATRLTVELLEGLVAGRPAAVALRNAQLALLRAPETAHPFYWGPFTLTE